MSIFDKIKNVIALNSESYLRSQDFRRRLSFELEMMMHVPEKYQVRLVGNPQMKLSEFLEKSGILQDHIYITYFKVIRHQNGKKYLDENLDYDEYSILDESCIGDRTIYLSYSTLENKGYLYLHLVTEGNTVNNDSLRTSVSLVHKATRENRLRVGKVLFTYDAEHPGSLLHKIRNIRRSAGEKLMKQKHMTDLELCSIGLDQSVPALCRNADLKMKAEEYGEAIFNLSRAHEIVKEAVLKSHVKEEEYRLFLEICQKLGECYQKRGLNNKSWYYLNCTDEETQILPEEYNITRLGTVLKNCFDILPSELSDMLWIDQESHHHGKLEAADKIWDLDLFTCMNGSEDMTLNISYREENDITINLYPENDLIKARFIIPAFLHSQSHSGKPRVLTLLFRNRAESEDAAKLFEFGSQAYEAKIWGDALYYLSGAYTHLQKKRLSGKSEESEQMIFGETCYMLGSIYSELRLYELSVFYLSIIADSGVIPWTMKFISSLMDIRDIKALEHVRYYYEQLQKGTSFQGWNDEWKKEFEIFLKRSYGNVLVSQGRLEEAECYFITLHKSSDETLKDFAQRELQSLQELKELS